MTIEFFVTNVLRIPVTKVSNRVIQMAIELYLDTREIHLYDQLSKLLGKSYYSVENAVRQGKNISIVLISPELKKDMLDGLDNVPSMEYIIRAAEYYRRNYANKEER